MRHLIHRLLGLSPQIAILASVKVRLALWYLAITFLVMFAFVGSFYGVESSILTNAEDAQLEPALYQQSQQAMASYQDALARGQPVAQQPMTLAAGEIVLLLRPDGTVLDERGAQAAQIAPQVQAHLAGSTPTFNLDQASAKTNPWHAANSGYRFVLLPVVEQNVRVADLAVGLPRTSSVALWSFWVPHALAIVLISTVVGYLLAGMAIRPVQKITKMADEITATDLRRRLRLARRDEFGALAATFDQMLARLEAAFKRQSQFTADASHELRTPLTIMNLDINRALTQEHTPEGYRQIIAQIQDENERMTVIVNSLLLLARADTGQIVLHQEAVDLGDLALECAERLMPLARQQHIQLAAGDLPELIVTGDRHYLSRMLTNLIENAIKYSSGVGSRVEVELQAEQGRWAVMRVRDDGPGIAEEHLPHLFERFYRGDKARARQERSAGRDEPGGAGLGLAIVQWIAQAHGGEVRVISALGAGSTFEVRLPLAQQDRDESRPAQRSPQQENTTAI
jgi:heavy metal sensor kinase